MEPFTVRMRVGLDDVDHVQVLYYPRVAHLGCLALEAFFRDHLELPWPQMLEEHRVAMPTVDLHITYRHPLRYGDEFDVSVGVVELGRRTVVFAMEIRKATARDLVSTIAHTAVFVSRDTWKAIPVPEDYRAALARSLK